MYRLQQTLTGTRFVKTLKEEMKEMKSWDDKMICVLDKGSRFVIEDTNSYIENVEHQINRSSFDRLTVVYMKVVTENTNKMAV